MRGDGLLADSGERHCERRLTAARSGSCSYFEKRVFGIGGRFVPCRSTDTAKADRCPDAGYRSLTMAGESRPPVAHHCDSSLAPSDRAGAITRNVGRVGEPVKGSLRNTDEMECQNCDTEPQPTDGAGGVDSTSAACPTGRTAGFRPACRRSSSAELRAEATCQPR